jgi:hypothetical protein
MLKSVAKKRQLKKKDFCVSCDYSDNWSVSFSETVIITVLKSIAKKRQLKKKDFHVSCDYSDNWSLWFSGDCYSGDPHVVNRSDIQSETPLRDTQSRDCI